MKQFPAAKLTLIDLSEQMLNVAKQRCSDEKQFTYICDDYTNYKFNTTFDIIISSLSIYHLTDEKKYELYENVYHHLNIGGIFINADQVLGESERLVLTYKQNLLSKV